MEVLLNEGDTVRYVRAEHVYTQAGHVQEGRAETASWRDWRSTEQELAGFLEEHAGLAAHAPEPRPAAGEPEARPAEFQAAPSEPTVPPGKVAAESAPAGHRVRQLTAMPLPSGPGGVMPSANTPFMLRLPVDLAQLGLAREGTLDYQATVVAKWLGQPSRQLVGEATGTVDTATDGGFDVVVSVRAYRPGRTGWRPPCGSTVPTTTSSRCSRTPSWKSFLGRAVSTRLSGRRWCHSSESMVRRPGRPSRCGCRPATAASPTPDRQGVVGRHDLERAELLASRGASVGRVFFTVYAPVVRVTSGGLRGQPSPIGVGHLPAEHRNLVPQHQQLHDVGRRAPCQQHQPSQQLAEDQIEQSKRHPSIIGASVSLSEVAAQSLRPTFRHPHRRQRCGGRCIRVLTDTLTSRPHRTGELLQSATPRIGGSDALVRPRLRLEVTPRFSPLTTSVRTSKPGVGGAFPPPDAQPTPPAQHALWAEHSFDHSSLAGRTRPPTHQGTPATLPTYGPARTHPTANPGRAAGCALWAGPIAKVQPEKEDS